MLHEKTKHFAIKLHFMRELVEKQKLELSYLTTENMPADILTNMPADFLQIFLPYLLCET